MADQSSRNRFSGPSGTLPEEVRAAFLEILCSTLLEIRANATLSGLCHKLADHAHNVPDFLQHPSPELLKFYWEVERPCFVTRMEAEGMGASMFKKPWTVIGEEYDKLQAL